MQLLLVLWLSLAAHANELQLGAEGTAQIEIVEANEKATLKVHLPDGNVQTIGGLGEHVQFLTKEGKSGKIAAQDFDGDGKQEFVVRVTVPPKASHVYVYRFDSELKKFRPMAFADDDHIVADYNEMVEVLPDGIAYEMEVWAPEDEFKTGAPSRIRSLWHFREKRFLPF